MSEEKANYKTRKQTIFRTIKNAENPFVMIDRRPLEDDKLSWKAKGVLAYLLSRPDNWIVRLGDLVKRSPDGVYAVRGAIKELKDAGHVSIREIRDEKQKFVRYEIEVYELPFTSKPLTNFPQADNPQAENLTLNDNDSNETDCNDIGANAPSLKTDEMPLEWQIGQGVEKITIPDTETAQRKDAATLISMGLGIRAKDAWELAFAFQDERKITFTNEQVKGQRKAIKFLLEKKITPQQVREAVRKLVKINYNCTDMFAIQKTADEIANPAPETKSEERNPLGI